MPQLSTTDLASELGVSKGRVSQWLAEGKLRGTYTGAGRARRYDLDAVRIALNKTLDTAQALGNGRATLAAIGVVQDAPSSDDDPAPEDGDLKRRYDLARTMRLEEQARAARRENDERSRTLVLASEVEAQVLAQIGREIAQIEAYIRSASRSLADAYSLDAKAVQAVLLTAWREYRGQRATEAAVRADNAKLTDIERSADF
jgi:predicted transcriptional regulator